MMTLDELLDQYLLEDFKNCTNTHRSMLTAVKRIHSAAAEGNLEAMQQALARYEELLGKQQENISSFKEKQPAFDMQSFLQEEFHQGFMAALAEEGLAVEADYPVYEVPPFKVRVFPEKELVTVNEKINRALRPRVLARQLKKMIEKLNAASFDAMKFLQALAGAYDTVTARQVARTKIDVNEQEVLLKEVYNTLTPMPQQKREYPQQLFAFDLHRLYRDGSLHAPDGRRLWLGNVRNQKGALIVLDAQGQPQRYGVIKFYREV